VIDPVALYLALCLAVAYGLLALHGWCWWRERRRRQGDRPRVDAKQGLRGPHFVRAERARSKERMR
jgi:hypothetical protein